jgi:hypothetical protein
VRRVERAARWLPVVGVDRQRRSGMVIVAAPVVAAVAADAAISVVRACIRHP